MTFLEYWTRLLSRNPQLSNPDTRMTLTVAKFRLALEAAHADGAESKATDKLWETLFGKGTG